MHNQRRLRITMMKIHLSQEVSLISQPMLLQEVDHCLEAATPHPYSIVALSFHQILQHLQFSQQEAFLADNQQEEEVCLDHKQAGAYSEYNLMDPHSLIKEHHCLEGRIRCSKHQTRARKMKMREVAKKMKMMMNQKLAIALLHIKLME